MYPGSRSGLLGVMDLYNEYAKIRASDVCVENGYVWMLKDHWWAMAKEGTVPRYPKGRAMNFIGSRLLFLSNEKHMEFLLGHKELTDKDSSFDKIFPKRLHDNVLGIKACTE